MGTKGSNCFGCALFGPGELHHAASEGLVPSRPNRCPPSRASVFPLFRTTSLSTPLPIRINPLPVIASDHLFKLRTAVARHGERDVADWWPTQGLLAPQGGTLFQRSFPRTHPFALARVKQMRVPGARFGDPDPRARIGTVGTR